MKGEMVSSVLLEDRPKFKDYYVIPEGHPLVHINEQPLEDAIKEIMSAVEFTRVFATHVRMRLEPILSIDFQKVDTNEITGIMIDIAKKIGVSKMTPNFLKNANDESDNILKTIDSRFSEAGMPINLEGIFMMPDDHRGFMLEFIRFWGLYHNKLHQPINQLNN